MFNRLEKLGATALLVSGLAACGGGSSDSGNNQTTNPVTNPSTTKLECRLGEMNINGVCSPTNNICTPEAEKVWVRGYLDSAYLWYSEIPSIKAEDYATPQTYFDALLVKNKDKFSSTVSKSEAEGFFESGLQLSFGVFWGYDAQDQLRVRFVEPNSPAAQAGIVRGDYVVSINNQAINSLTDEQVLQFLQPKENTQLAVKLSDATKTTVKDVQLLGQELVTSPVPLYGILTSQQNQDKVGYLLFNDHIATASDKLVEAVSYFKQQEIKDLVLDLRFNGGGYNYIANELAAMIGGTKTQNQIFTRLLYNDKYPPEYEYFTKTSFIAKTTLPYLDLPRVFVLTSKETCSASESIINNLLPFMQVIRVGNETCGKPYGMTGANNCDTTYFAITMKGENSNNQSVPTTGFTPSCLAYETFDYALGNPQEGLLSAALYYRDTGQCSISSAVFSKKLVNKTATRPLFKPQWQQNTIISGNQ